MAQRDLAFSKILSEYQRPVRTSIWVILITIAFLYILFTGGKEDISRVLELMLIGMFADMGIYSGLKTYEKVKQARIDGTQNVVDTVTHKDTNITNLNVDNENVIIDGKNKSNIKGIVE